MAKFKVGDHLVMARNDWFKKGTRVTVILVDNDDVMPYLCSDGKRALWVEENSLASSGETDKKSEFHVGQRVRIRSFEDLAKEFGSKDCPHRFTVRGSVIFNENMERLCGRTATIKSLPESGDHILLENWSDKGGDAHWNFLTEMLEPAGFEVGQIYRSDCDGAEKGNIIRITGVSEYLIDYTPICGKINGAPWFMPLSRFCDGLVLLTGPQIEEAIRKYDAEHAEKKADVREVKRHARVGEYIKIVDADMPGIGETYKNGDIVRVIGDSDDEAGAIDIDRKDAPFVNDSEYVVLEGYKPPKNGKHVYSAIDIQTAKDFVLRTIYTLAEKDVNVILSHSSSDEDDDSAFSCYILDHDTAVDADEDTFRASAVRYSSLCSENDEPNEWIGKAVALCKALHKPLPNYVR